jgi:hypothetical protein
MPREHIIREEASEARIAQLKSKIATLECAVLLAIEHGTFPQGSGVLHELRAALGVEARCATCRGGGAFTKGKQPGELITAACDECGIIGANSVRTPLTDEQIEPLFREVRAMPTTGQKDEWFWFAWGVEMGERAHDIGGVQENGNG